VIADNENVRRPDARVERQPRHGCKYIVPELGHFTDVDVPENPDVFL
jgi:hypothetical protein